MDIRPLDPPTADEATLRAWHDCRVAAAEVDDPEPAPALPWTVSWLHSDAWGQRRNWVAVDGSAGGRVLGGASLNLLPPDNPRLCELDVLVRPDVRRSGVGRALLRVAAEAAARDGRGAAMSWWVKDGPTAGFGTAAGFREALVSRRSVLDVGAVARADVDRLAEEAARHAVGYDLVRWTDRCPDELVDGFARLEEAMYTAPKGDLALEPYRWDVERVRAGEAAATGKGLEPYAVCARETASGELVALTTLYCATGDPAYAEQGDTVVLPGHRGHRLGLLVKTAMLRWLLDTRRGLERIETSNAESNTPMLAVNTALGFRRVDLWSEAQADLADVLRFAGAATASSGRRG